MRKPPRLSMVFQRRYGKDPGDPTRTLAPNHVAQQGYGVTTHIQNEHGHTTTFRNLVCSLPPVLQLKPICRHRLAYLLSEALRNAIRQRYVQTEDIVAVAPKREVSMDDSFTAVCYIKKHSLEGFSMYLRTFQVRILHFVMWQELLML